MWEGGGCGAGWGGIVMWVCKREKDIDVWVCMCLIAVFLIRAKLTCIF